MKDPINTAIDPETAAGKPLLPVALPATLPVFLDPYAEIKMSLNRLPHWQQDGRTYFVTFRLDDSIPRERMELFQEERDAWLRFHPQPWSHEIEREYVRRFANTLERWLDESLGSCTLRDGEPQRLVAGALAHFEGERRRRHCWVIMPNHVHALFSMCEGHALEDLLQRWKRFTSRQINRLVGRSGSLWQKSYYDRLIRNEEHFWNAARYIRRNPEKARLQPGEYALFEIPNVREGLNERLGEATFQPPSTEHGRLESRPSDL